MQTTDSTGIDWCITFLEAFQVGIHFNIYLNSIKQCFQSLCKKSKSGLVLRDRCGEQMWTWPLFNGLPSAKPTEKWAPFPSQQKGNRKRFKLPSLSPLPCVEDWGKEIFLTPNSYSRIQTPKKQTNYCFKTKQATAHGKHNSESVFHYFASAVNSTV